MAAPACIPSNGARALLSLHPVANLCWMTGTVAEGEVTPRWGLRPACTRIRGKFRSTAAAKASRRCCPGKTGGAQDSGSPCAVPTPRAPAPAPRGTAAPSQGTGAASPKGPWTGRRAEAGCAGSRRPPSRGTRLGRGRPPPPWGGIAVSCSEPSRVFRLKANREAVRAGRSSRAKSQPWGHLPHPVQMERRE